MVALLLGVMFASFIGSLHCIGMCGGFVAFYAGHTQHRTRGIQRTHLAYNGGRLVTYLLLGFVFGSAGAALEVIASSAGFRSVVMLIAGSFMVLWGVLMLFQQKGVMAFHLPLPVVWKSWISHRYRALVQKPPLWRAAWLGFFSSLLPCGWLYVFALMAAGTGHPFDGVLVMFAFWLGTLPAMFGLALGVEYVGVWLKKQLPWLSATTVILVGLLTFWQRASLPLSRPSQTQTPSSHTPVHLDSSRKSPIQRVPTKPHCHEDG